MQKKKYTKPCLSDQLQVQLLDPKAETLVSPLATWQCWAEPPHWHAAFSEWETYPEGKAFA